MFFKNFFFSDGEYASLACSIIYFLLGGNISSPVIPLYLFIFPDDNADIFAASLLISSCNFLPLILSSIIVMISFYILSKRFFLKHEGLYDVRVTSITKKEYGFAAHYL